MYSCNEIFEIFKYNQCEAMHLLMIFGGTLFESQVRILKAED